MTDRLYVGCVIPSRLPFVEAAARFIISKLDLDIIDLPDRICCMEPVGLRSMDREAWLKVSSRLLAQSDGGAIVSLCDGCAMSLSDCSAETGTHVVVKDFLEVLSDNSVAIKAAVVRPFSGTFAVFPGCHCEDVCARNHRDAIMMLSDVITAIGGKPIRPRQNLCCGGGVSMIDDGLSKKILNESIDSFRASGADAVMTSCPFCFMQFDMVAKYRTYQIAEAVAKAIGWEVDTEKYHRGR